MRAKHLVAWVACCTVASARAETPPSADFWLYLLEYGNAEGEVFDPLDLDAIDSKPLANADDTPSPADAPATAPAQKEKTP